MPLRNPFAQDPAPEDIALVRRRLAALLPRGEAGVPESPEASGHGPSDLTDSQDEGLGGTPDHAAPVADRPRLGVSRAGVAVVAGFALLAVLLGAWLLWRGRPVVARVGPASAAFAAPAVSGAPTAWASAAPAPPPAEILVDVQGKVRRPGVVRLPAGSRVLDAILAAGGPRAGVSTAAVNLARPLADGEQVVLAAPGQGVPGAAAAGVGAGAAGSAPAAPVDLNTATLADLDGLPGIGPVMAQRILDFRTEHGRFTSIDELQEVSGIGPAKFAALRSKVRV